MPVEVAAREVAEAIGVRPDRRSSGGISIQMSSGVGSGSTPLAAFDAALRQVGAANFNLVQLSSVIPAGSEIRPVARIAPRGRWGDRLYCVYAEAHAEVPGQSAAAGVGWMLSDDASGKGLFVEHHGSTEQEVAAQIEASLADMGTGRGGGFGPPQMSITAAVCAQQPMCVLVLAAYPCGWW